MISLRALGNDPKFERLLLAVFALLAVAAGIFEYRSPVARAIREGTALTALVAVKSPQGQAGSYEYAVILSPKEGALDLAYLTEPHSMDASALNRFQVIFSLTMPDQFGSPGNPFDVKRWVLSQQHNALYWLRVARWVGSIRRQIGPSASRYDGWLLALELARLDSGSLRLRRLDGSQRSVDFLDRLLSGAPTPAPAPLSVAVSNASDQPGVALEATKILRSKGIDVLDFGNAPAPAERSEFIDWTGSLADARRVRAALGCRNADTITRMDAAATVTATAVLGRDYRECLSLSGDKRR